MPKIKDIPKVDRPREKLLKKEHSSFFTGLPCQSFFKGNYYKDSEVK
ncbi:MAG: hypothetical protein Ctma_1181 [Catillopecten margaritatus gill symbiont]|uniref:Uncharacterized protein n=1 Tax=Catillopecten margaritatus gill symbiont TaxID=3083288 RepID=A0AAU6PHD8_9GAMM